MIYLLNMVIFYSFLYVCLPECIAQDVDSTHLEHIIPYAQHQFV